MQLKMAELLETHERNIELIRAVVAEMPESLPVAWLISENEPPSVHYTSHDQSHVLPIVNHFGRTGWKQRDNLGRTEFIKTVGGVLIVIENAVRRPYTPEPIEFPEPEASRN